MTPYSGRFFRERQNGARSSARVVVPLVLAATGARSVVDVGCGVGTWLAVFRELGTERILGVDGDYVDPAQLEIPADHFLAHDLREPLHLDERFDLAVCLEVAEHLPAAAATRLVADLTGLAPVVLFSAAIPGQGGTGHVGERWQDEWAELFAEREYDPVDLVRPAIWEDPAVDEWYAQNMLLYVARSEARRFPRLAAAGLPLRIVHPRVHAAQAIEPGVRPAAARLAGALRRAAARRAPQRPTD
jgi:SAM-dependent methyltransferase